MLKTPKMSIGMPVFNGAEMLEDVLNNFQNQTFSDYEIIISDNGSTDATEIIARKFASLDNRIRYFRQPNNLGAEKNFLFVLEQATAKYFMWAACDDLRSDNFLMENIKFLDTNPDYVASTCPNNFGDANDGKPITFDLTGKVEERFANFLKFCWLSHGIFYSVMRTKVIRECDILGQSFLGSDWGVDLFLASRGNVNRTNVGFTSFGVSGVSSKAGIYKLYRNNIFDWIVPFSNLSKYTLKLASDFSLRNKIFLILLLTKLNSRTAVNQIHTSLYQLYRNFVDKSVKTTHGV